MAGTVLAEANSSDAPGSRGRVSSSAMSAACAPVWEVSYVAWEVSGQHGSLVCTGMRHPS